jgi:hypothetical protein
MHWRPSVENNARSDEPSRRDRAATAWKLSTGEDLENALRAAERLLAQAEERRRHEQNRTYAILSTMVAATLSLFASIFAATEFLAGGYVRAQQSAAFLTVLAVFAVLMLSIRALLRQRRQIDFDFTLRLAVELASMINEALLDVAEREKWSYLRLQATKLRLSGFPLIVSGRDIK